jgi:hypothetical protein
MSTVSRNCRNHGQRLQGGGMITPPSFGSRGPAPGILRSLLPLCCSNSRRTTSVRLCECEPRMASHVKSMGDYGSFKIPAKIAVSQGCYNPVEVPCFLPTKLRSPTGVFRPNGETCQGLFVRASAQFFQQRCIRAEARRGHFPPLFRQSRTWHQTGPP